MRNIPSGGALSSKFYLNNMGDNFYSVIQMENILGPKHYIIIMVSKLRYACIMPFNSYYQLIRFLSFNSLG